MSQMRETYHHRAEECRTMASDFRDADSKRQLLRIADEYDRMATQAAVLEIQLQELAASKLKSKLA
jgi:hypothetical protein